MVGNPRYGRMGLMMLPVKAIDTLQPLYGLTGAVLLAIYLASGRLVLVGSILGVIGAKIGFDLCFHGWSLLIYRRWLGRPTGLALAPALLASLVEPFSFQVLRHLGAALGWASFLRGSSRWGAQSRTGITREGRPEVRPLDSAEA